MDQIKLSIPKESIEDLVLSYCDKNEQVPEAKALAKYIRRQRELKYSERQKENQEWARIEKN